MISTVLTLPCGAVLKNRLVKSAMTERISNRNYEPVKGHNRLYEDWSATGAGLLITGNVVIDRKHLESAGNVCFDDENMLPKLKSWAEAGKKHGNHIWAQISHSGRQTNRFGTGRPLAPSEVQLKKLGLFGKPKAMTEEDILKVIQGFAKAAQLAKEAGFTLKEIKELLVMKNSKIACSEVREFALSKMDVVEEKMLSLEKQHTVLREFVTSCDANAAKGLNVCHMSFSQKRDD